MKNVESIYKEALCCSCGFCIGVCPHNAISYKIDRHGFFMPIVDDNSCTGCVLCYDLCSGKNELKIESKEIKDSYYYGYSQDEDIRINSSSGGVATELLCYLVEQRIINYVTVMSNWVNNERPKPILTNDIEIIRDCKTSKYCPIPFGEIIEQIDNADGTIAVLGLPCQINSLKKLVTKNKRLKNKIKFYFSLLCNHTPSYSATFFLAENLKIKDWTSIKYRGSGWPGKMELTSDSNNIIKQTPFRKTWATGFGIYFKNRRCLICNDPFAKGADIVFGDAYFMEREEKGMTFFIVRNEKLKQLLIEMKNRNILNVEEGPEISVIKKYFKTLFDREEEYSRKIKMLKTLYLKTPIYKVPDNVHFSLKQLIQFKISLQKINYGKYHILWRYLFKKNNGQNLKIETYENS